MNTIGLCSDHAGFKVKEFVKSYLESNGYTCKDFGTYNEDSCDYPDFAHLLAHAIEDGGVYRGIAVCGSGQGISMTLNKHQGIRAALCWKTEIARLSREHNDANVLALPGRFISNEEASEIVDTFLSTPFESGRHQERVNKIPI